MQDAAKNIRRGVRRFWRGVREWCGDAAYNNSIAATPGRTAAAESLSLACTFGRVTLGQPLDLLNRATVSRMLSSLFQERTCEESLYLRCFCC